MTSGERHTKQVNSTVHLFGSFLRTQETLHRGVCETEDMCNAKLVDTKAGRHWDPERIR